MCFHANTPHSGEGHCGVASLLLAGLCAGQSLLLLQPSFRAAPRLYRACCLLQNSPQQGYMVQPKAECARERGCCWHIAVWLLMAVMQSTGSCQGNRHMSDCKRAHLAALLLAVLFAMMPLQPCRHCCAGFIPNHPACFWPF